MESGYLLDSNVIIGYLAAKIPESGIAILSDIINQTPHISVISQIEVLRFNDTPENEAILEGFINVSNIYPLNAAIVSRTIELCKQSKIRLPDAIIAATALTENLILVTRNTNDFKNITDLEIFDPWHSLDDSLNSG